jgi:hypothetical protein
MTDWDTYSQSEHSAHYQDWVAYWTLSDLSWENRYIIQTDKTATCFELWENAVDNNGNRLSGWLNCVASFPTLEAAKLAALMLWGPK